jgi:lysophospholipid acyltransferase (LPLAT)-like uncharacterized protein
MSALRGFKWNLIGILGKWILWVWAKSTRMTVLGEDRYNELREQNKPVIILVWHGKIFIAPYFFRRRGIMPLVSPSEDGEIIAQIVARWGYKVLRGSSSHSIIRAWGEMRTELKRGGEVIIVPDGPRGPSQKMKPGALKLAQETGAYLVPFTFTSSRKKNLDSWDRFLIPKPFSKVVTIYGEPFSVRPDLSDEEFERERLKIESFFAHFDSEADQYFD